MRKDTLARLGRATWGSGWAFELALALAVHPDTVKKWQSGRTAIRPEMRHRIMTAALQASRERHKTVQKIVLGLKNHPDLMPLRRKPRKRVETPLQRYRKLAQGIMRQSDF